MLVACASAQYLGYPYGYAGYTGLGYAATPYTAYSAPAVWGPKHQYQAKNELGMSTYGYSYPGQAAHNVQDAAGNDPNSLAHQTNRNFDSSLINK